MSQGCDVALTTLTVRERIKEAPGTFLYLRPGHYERRRGLRIAIASTPANIHWQVNFRLSASVAIGSHRTRQNGAISSAQAATAFIAPNCSRQSVGASRFGKGYRSPGPGLIGCIAAWGDGRLYPESVCCKTTQNFAAWCGG